MMVPVTVISSVVLALCFFPFFFSFGCANASGASNVQQIRTVIGFFMLCLLLIFYVTVDSPLQRDSEARAARNLDFPPSEHLHRWKRNNEHLQHNVHGGLFHAETL